MFEPFIRPIQGSVNLGMRGPLTQFQKWLPSSSALWMTISRASKNCGVSSIRDGSHIITGLPDIARTFGTLFIKMIQKAMDSPTPLRRSRAHPSAQAVINHSYWSNQSLLVLSNSESESDEELFSGIRLIIDRVALLMTLLMSSTMMVLIM